MLWHEAMYYLLREEHRMLLRQPVLAWPTTNTTFIDARGEHRGPQHS